MYRIGKEELSALETVITARDLFKINDGVQMSKQVEGKLQTIIGSKYPIFMTSGHAALSAALVALGIGPGDQVIVPAYTYISTAMAVVEAGAIPVIAEVDETLTLSVEDTRKKITPYTKAIVPVHIQGFPCDMDAIMALAKEHGLFVVEDACQADGGSFRGKRLGTIGDAGAFSFNYYKIITSGEGGALLTDRRDVYERALIYHDSSAVAFFGDQTSGFSAQGFCGREYRSNELCAAVMNVQLDRLDGILHDLRKNKAYLMAALEGHCAFLPSHDIEGDCGTTLALRFESEAAARKVAEQIGGVLPIDTGKHVYRRWEPIMQKRGALHPLMDPFKMEANAKIVPEYHEEMCPQTLDYLSKTVYLSIDPDATEETLAPLAEKIKAAL